MQKFSGNAEKPWVSMHSPNIWPIAKVRKMVYSRLAEKRLEILVFSVVALDEFLTIRTYERTYRSDKRSKTGTR